MIEHYIPPLTNKMVRSFTPITSNETSTKTSQLPSLLTATRRKRTKPTDFFRQEELDTLTEKERKLLEEAAIEEPPEVPPEEAEKSGKAYEELIKKKLRDRKGQ
jgi:hypothetical protein